VTICNVYPFGHDEENSLTWSKYVAEMTAKKEQWPYERLKSILPNLSVAEYGDIWRDLFSHLGFATNLMPNITSQLRASQSQRLIVYCMLFNKDWNDAAQCTLRFRWDQTYQKCYTIRIPRNMTEVRVVHFFDIHKGLTKMKLVYARYQHIRFYCSLIRSSDDSPIQLNFFWISGLQSTRRPIDVPSNSKAYQ